jgi:hypothetical protein
LSFYRFRQRGVYQSFMAVTRYFAIALCPLGEAPMSTDMLAASADEPAEAAAEAPANTSKWAETALTVLFTAAAVLFVSFLAVVSGIV